MSTHELDLFDEVATIAAKMPELHFTEPDDDWTPVAFFEDADGTRATMPIEMFMQDDRTKDMLVDLILPKVIKEFSARKLVMVLSVWQAKMPEGITDPQDYPRPSQALNREEQLLLTEYTAEGVTRYVMAPIIRHEDAPPTLGEWEEMPADAAREGRFIEPIVAAMKRVR